MKNLQSMAYQKKVWASYTMEELTEIAKSCSSKEDFRKNYKQHYNYCIKHKIKNHIMSLIPHKKKWTKEALLLEAKKYNKRSDWMSANISAYNTALKSDFYDECVEHMEKKSFGKELVWTYDSIREIYSKYDNIKDLRENETSAYNAAIRYGYHRELGKDLDRAWNKKKKWTFENVAKEALKYNSIKELQVNSPSAYNLSLIHI